MGTRPAVSYANLFMAHRIDKKITSLAAELQNGNNPLLCYKRFLDDIFTIYTGTLENLHKFLEELNNIHPTIKFTMNHTTPSSIFEQISIQVLYKHFRGGGGSEAMLI